MANKKNIFVIVGSASENSANEKLVNVLAELNKDELELKIYKDLKQLPHFDPELSVDNPPSKVRELREEIEKADGVIISTPEYIFSIPSGLKNAIEWCVTTTVFTDKPLGIITASAHGQKGHEELQLIMRTVMAAFSEDTTLLIQGIKGKIDPHGLITDPKTEEDILHFSQSFKKLVTN